MTLYPPQRCVVGVLCFSFVTWAPLRRGFFAAGTAFQWRPRPGRITGAYPRTLRSASAGAGRSQKVILRSRIGTRAFPAKDGDLRTRAPAPRAARAPRTRWGARGSAGTAVQINGLAQ